MKRFYLYDPKNRAYGLCYKNVIDAIASVKAMRSRYTKEVAERYKKRGSLRLARDYQCSYEYWSRVIVRETKVTTTKDHEVK